MYYVSMTDNFMSGWGQADGKKNKYVVECDTLAQAQAIVKAAEDRPEMKRINICMTMPKYSASKVLVSKVHASDLSGKWLKYMNEAEVDTLQTKRAV